MIRGGKISFAPQILPMQKVITEHLMDLKRVRATNKLGDDTFVWRKSSQGKDHFFFALLYLILASFLRGVSQGSVSLPFLVSKFKLKNFV
jgi:hypothetical protein